MPVLRAKDYTESVFELFDNKRYLFGRSLLTIEDRIESNKPEVAHMTLPGCSYCSYTYKCFSLRHFNGGWTLSCEFPAVQEGVLFLNAEKTECYDPVLYPLFNGTSFTFGFAKAPFKVSVLFSGAERPQPSLFEIPMPLSINLDHSYKCCFPVYLEMSSFVEPANPSLQDKNRGDEISTRWFNLKNPNLGKHIYKYRTAGCLDISHFQEGQEYIFGRIDENHHKIDQQFYVPMCVAADGAPASVSYGHFSITRTPYGYVFTTKKKLPTDWSVRIISSVGKERSSCLNPVNFLLEKDCRVDVGTSLSWVSFEFKTNQKIPDSI
jgi:hypothetical protein